jgi:hypothetical protein
MATKSIISIDVDDSAWKKFQKAFDDFTDDVKDVPKDVDKIGKAWKDQLVFIQNTSNVTHNIVNNTSNIANSVEKAGKLVTQ